MEPYEWGYIAGYIDLKTRENSQQTHEKSTPEERKRRIKRVSKNIHTLFNEGIEAWIKDLFKKEEE